MAPATRVGDHPRPRPATPTDVSAAIAQRRRAEERRRRRTAAAVAALVLLSLLLLWLVRFSPVLAARNVEVTGASRVSADEVVRVAQVPVGTPLARLQTRPVAQRVADAMTPVATVQVTTSLPGTVRIQVTERTPVYQREAGGQYQLVDASGVVFAVQSRPTKGLLPVRTRGVDNRLLAEVATVVRSLPPDLVRQVERVQADGPDRIALVLTKGRTVLWGSAAGSEQKVPVLKALLGQEAVWFDVSSPGSPSTR